ncbi:putative hydro-lyase [Ottowia thiooxydans]|uniref:Putative hydro-lyase ABIE13_004874 n=1 Tax=Ottowia thiooxydans TaxID=219182 RepID=A0ABV2QFC4_9BURK
MTSPASEARLRVRLGEHSGHTGGLAPGYVQANLVILPEAYVADFLRFCQGNPQACPLLAVSEPGDPALPRVGSDIDIRTDLPRYRVWRNGVLAAEPTEIQALWRDDFVSFLIGCSFSFEQALIEGGISLRHVEQGRNVAMYRTSIATQPAGPFRGSLVVSMRPLRPSDVIRAIQITSRFPAVHGAPVHIGKPELIGIDDLALLDYGDAVEIRDDELPVFWACGVTPQSVVQEAKIPLCITHSPGCLLITDLKNTHLASL